MISNYIKSAIRALIKYKGTTIINILGLAIGICATIMISIYVYNEVNYDRFHKNADQIYRVGVVGKMMGNDLDMAVTPCPMAWTILEEFPEIENVVRLYRSGGHVVTYEDQSFNENGFLYADSSFFEVFSFDLIQGDPNQVLDDPNSIVITETIANKFFKQSNPIGKGLQINSSDNIYTVTGVIQDPTANSHFHFDYLASLHSIDASRRTNWLSHNFYTYVLVKEGTSQEQLTQSLNTLQEKYVGPLLTQLLNMSLEDFYSQGNTFRYITTGLTDIHLESDQQYEFEPNGNKSYVWVFGALAFLILIVASINFVNLSTARSADRSLEVGIRKLLGSSRSRLIAQFLTESTILSLLALLIAVIAAILMMPSFNNLINSNLSFNPFSSIQLLVVLLALGLLVGLLAGIYPALGLAATKAVHTLKGRRTGTGGKGRLRKILVVLQFTVTLIILTSTISAYRQLRYMQKKDLGFNKENVYVIRNGEVLGEQYEAFRGELMNHSEILQVGRSHHIPGQIFSNNAHFVEGRGSDKIYTLMETRVSHEWDEIMGLEMTDGRFFDVSFSTDSGAVILNEAAVRDLEMENPLEENMWIPPFEDNPAVSIPIIGVVKNFHFESMKKPIGPAIFYVIGSGSYGYMSIKTNGTNHSEAISIVEQSWNQFVPDYPLDAFWLEDYFDNIFIAEKQTSTILLVFSLLSILVSCLGLLGMISFTTRIRAREIAIRKTYGSTIRQVILLLFKETYSLLLIAAILAIPSYYMINHWMQNFAYRIQFDAISFGITLLVVALSIITIAVITIGQEAFKAAKKNPALVLTRG